MPEPNFLPWVKQRHYNAAAYHSFRSESSFKGTVNAMLNRYFETEKNWLVIPEIMVQHVIEDKNKEYTPNEPNLDDDDDMEQQHFEKHRLSINAELGYNVLTKHIGS